MYIEFIIEATLKANGYSNYMNVIIPIQSSAPFYQLGLLLFFYCNIIIIITTLHRRRRAIA